MSYIHEREDRGEKSLVMDASFPEFVAALKVSLCEQPRTRGLLIAHIFSSGI